MDDYTTVDLTVRRLAPTLGWEVSASLRNAFNADAREPTLPGGALPNDLPLAGRGFWLQALHRF